MSVSSAMSSPIQNVSTASMESPVEASLLHRLGFSGDEKVHQESMESALGDKGNTGQNAKRDDYGCG